MHVQVWYLCAACCAIGASLVRAEGNLHVGLLRVPEGGLAPQVAADAAGRVHLVYFKGDPAHGDVYYARLDDLGKTWGKAIRVNSQPGSAIVIGSVRGPQMALGKSGRVHVAWNGSDRAEPRVDGKSTPMLYTRLADSGAFEPQRNLITRYAGLDGGGSVAADPAGNVYVAWHAPRAGHDEADRCVWIARSQDEGKTFQPETAAVSDATGACGCCALKIEANAKGDVYVLYRTATDSVERDMRSLVSHDHAATFKAIASDPWHIGACVMSTGSIDTQGASAVAAWETRGHVRFAMFDYDKAHELITAPGDSDKQKHPSVAINERGEFIIAWAEGTGWNRGGSVRWQVFDRTGKPVDEESGSVPALAVWSMPAVAVVGGRFVVVF